jgi:hypothetical protein
MQRVPNRLIYVVALATMIVAACTDTASRTDLNPDGPPMIRQVRMVEKYMDGTPPIERSRRVFAFGTHELATEAEVASNRPAGMVTSAAAMNGIAANRIRIIVDELLVGNYIEEIACRGTVDADALTRVPVTATPEDIARCSGPDDTLPKRCPASNKNSVCICQNDAGCPLAGNAAKVIAKGQPVGVLDIDEDGAADESRMIENAVGIKCNTLDATRNNVPLNLDASYWNPSGDQNRPAAGGFDALGPAIVLEANPALPTNTECQLVFADGSAAFPDTANAGQPLHAIVDKEDKKICAPINGNVDAGCTEGDISAFKFKTEQLNILQASISDGQTGVPINIGAMGSPIDIVWNVPIPTTAAAAVTFQPALPAAATVTITGTPFPRQIHISGPMGTNLAANTTYTMTISTNFKDTFGQPLAAPKVITFTTGT